MRNLKEYVVRVRLPSGRQTFTTIKAEDFTGARELSEMLFGDRVMTIPVLVEQEREGKQDG